MAFRALYTNKLVKNLVTPNQIAEVCSFGYLDLEVNCKMRRRCKHLGTSCSGGPKRVPGS